MEVTPSFLIDALRKHYRTIKFITINEDLQQEIFVGPIKIQHAPSEQTAMAFITLANEDWAISIFNVFWSWSFPHIISSKPWFVKPAFFDPWKQQKDAGESN